MRSDFTVRSRRRVLAAAHVIIDYVDRAKAEAEFAHLNDVVLFDVMSEAANGLIGRLVALQRAAEEAGDLALAGRWRQRYFDVADECEAIDPRDRAAQGAAALAWWQERDRLPRPPR